PAAPRPGPAGGAPGFTGISAAAKRPLRPGSAGLKPRAINRNCRSPAELRLAAIPFCPFPQDPSQPRTARVTNEYPMRKESSTVRPLRRSLLLGGLALAAVGTLAAAGRGFARPGRQPGDNLSPMKNDWGAITAPVFGTSETGVYSGAELFAGPKKFGPNYFA